MKMYTHSMEIDAQKYGIVGHFSNTYNLNSVELFSQTDDDIEVIANIDAHMFATGHDGKIYPFDIIISFFGIPLDEGESIYEMNRRELWDRQKICAEIIIFETEEHKNLFQKDFNRIQ